MPSLTVHHIVPAPRISGFLKWLNFSTFGSEAIYGLLAALCMAASQWVVFTLIVKLKGVAAGGEYAIGMAILTPLLAFSNMDMRAIYSSDHEDRHSFGAYLSARAIASVVGLLTALVLYMFVGLEGSQRRIEFAALAGYRFIDLQSDLMNGVFQKKREMSRSFMSTLLKTLTGSCAFLCILLLFDELVYGYIALGVTSAAVFLLFEKRWVASHEEITIRLDKTAIAILRSASVVGLSLVFGNATASVPRLVLAHTSSTAEVGVLAALTYIIIPVGFIATALCHASVPIQGRLWAEGNIPKFRQFLRRIIVWDGIMGTTLCVMLVFAPQSAIVFLFNEEVGKFGAILPLFGFVALLLSAELHLAVALTIVGMYRHLFALQLLRLAVCAIIAFVAIVRCGIIGAILAGVFSGLFFCLMASSKLLFGNELFAKLGQKNSIDALGAT